jgi:Flp pilus assembly secretin CpaC
VRLQYLLTALIPFLIVQSVRAQDRVLFDVHFLQADATARTAFADKRTSGLKDSDQTTRSGSFDSTTSTTVHRLTEDANIDSIVLAQKTRDAQSLVVSPVLDTDFSQEATFLVGGRYRVPARIDPSGADSPGVIRRGNPPPWFWVDSPAPAPLLTDSPPRIAEQDFGMRLSLFPLIVRDSKLLLRVRTRVTAVDFSRATRRNGYLIPAIVTTGSDQEVEVKEGQSIAITGLSTDQSLAMLKDVPELSDERLLKQIMDRQSAKDGTALVVLVTPRFSAAKAP